MAIKTSKLILYHIPKCGGIWAKEALRRSLVNPATEYGRCKSSGQLNDFHVYREHATPDGTSEKDKAGRYSVVFVRHPFTWYRSFWAFRIKSKSYDPKFPLDQLMDTSYEVFIRKVLDKYPEGFCSSLFRCYVGDDLSKVQFIGRQENLEDHLVHAMRFAQQEFDEGRLRRTKMINVAGIDPKFDELTRLPDRLLSDLGKAEQWAIDTFYV